ncbi:MAG: DNA-directed RNA polymerase subunit H [archaeon]
MADKFDITKHILVPKHVKLNEKEKEKILQQYGITIKELPTISKNDAMVKKLDAKPGDVIKILRKSSTAGDTAFYRGVSDVQ